MKPYLIIETECDYSFAIGFLVFVQKDCSEGVIQHEIVHVKQFYRTLGFATVLYKVSQYYRLKYEVEAFKKQIEVDKLSDLEVIRLAGVIADDYNIDYITEDDIFASLKG